MQSLFSNLDIVDKKDEDLPGFAWFWKNFPKDPMRPHKKSGKDECRKKWKMQKLEKKLNLVKYSLKQDMKSIKDGIFAFSHDSSDRMYWFPGILPWMNQKKWSRDIEEEPKAKPKVVEQPIVHRVMTPQEKAEMMPVWKAIAQRRAMYWPRRSI